MSASDHTQAPAADAEAGSAIGGAQPAAAKLAPAFARNLKILAGLVLLSLVAVVVLIQVASRGPGTSREASSVPVNPQLTPTDSTPSPHLQDKLLATQQQEASEARAKGATYVPPEMLIPRGPGESDYAKAARAVGVQEAGAAQGAADPRDALRLQTALAELPKMAVLPAVQRVSVQAQREADGAAGASADAPRTPTAYASGQGASPAATAPLVVDALEIFSARLASPIDTDAGNYASAEITSGRLAGALLVGNVALMGEGASVTFTAMRHGGQTYPISAIALDVDTSTNAVAGNVDRKLLQRFVLPVVMAYTGAYATAKAQTARTITSIPVTGIGGSTGVTGVGSELVGITQPSPTAPQARAAGVAAAVGIGQRETQRLAQEPIRVSLPVGAAIGVMFRAPVSSAVTGRALAAQASASMSARPTDVVAQPLAQSAAPATANLLAAPGAR